MVIGKVNVSVTDTSGSVNKPGIFGSGAMQKTREQDMIVSHKHAKTIKLYY